MSYLGQAPGQGEAERFTFTASGGETSVTHATDGLAINYSVGQVEVYLNGIKLVSGSDFTATNGSTISGLSALSANDVVDIVALSQFSPADTVPASGGTFSGEITAPSLKLSSNIIKASDGGTAITLDTSDNVIFTNGGKLFSGLQVFTADATWTKPSGVTAVQVFVTGGGGGGGGSTLTNAPGGGAGGTSIKFITTGIGSTESITVGSAGTVTSNGAGGNGGTSSFGSHCTATGGTGGPNMGFSGASGGSGASGDINFDGGDGGVRAQGNPDTGGGHGGASYWGGGGRGASYNSQANGEAGQAFGSGGGGSSAEAVSRSGGLGKSGIVVVYEYKG